MLGLARVLGVDSTKDLVFHRRKSEHPSAKWDINAKLKQHGKRLVTSAHRAAAGVLFVPGREADH